MEPIIDQYVSAIQITPKLGIDFNITKFHANWWSQGANSCHAKFHHDSYAKVKFPVRTEHYFVVM